ncbi:MAG: choloylglycine hydrolase [Clostridium sp.]|uniref:choloylglycine hydrolase n=1 Tax=Clostridium sp. TaxID=1506 RepID=UPI002FCA303B
MCTAITLQTTNNKCLFGRNMDLEGSFYQAPHLTPRNFKYNNVVTGQEESTKYAILGMGTLIDSHPMYADAVNEKGLACAGLNFPDFACYEEECYDGMVNLGPHDFILWILGNFESVDSLLDNIDNVNIVNKPFKEGMYIAALHWMVTDKTGKSVVLEKTFDGLNIYDSSCIGVLTNTPSYDYHLTNINQYIGLSPNQPKESVWCSKEIKPLAVGLGAVGLPGDLSSVSRFIKSSYLKANIGSISDINQGINEFYHILSGVSMIGSSVLNNKGIDEKTIYTSCMDLENIVYYYKTYSGNNINAVDMKKENLDRDDIKVFEYIDSLEINYQN